MVYVENKRKELQRAWPITSGLGADDKHEGRTTNLVPQTSSKILWRDRAGIR